MSALAQVRTALLELGIRSPSVAQFLDARQGEEPSAPDTLAAMWLSMCDLCLLHLLGTRSGSSWAASKCLGCTAESERDAKAFVCTCLSLWGCSVAIADSSNSRHLLLAFGWLAATDDLFGRRRDAKLGRLCRLHRVPQPPLTPDVSPTLQGIERSADQRRHEEKVQDALEGKGSLGERDAAKMLRSEVGRLWHSASTLESLYDGYCRSVHEVCVAESRQTSGVAYSSSEVSLLKDPAAVERAIKCCAEAKLDDAEWRKVEASWWSWLASVDSSDLPTETPPTSVPSDPDPEFQALVQRARSIVEEQRSGDATSSRWPLVHCVHAKGGDEEVNKESSRLESLCETSRSALDSKRAEVSQQLRAILKRFEHHVTVSDL